MASNSVTKPFTFNAPPVDKYKASIWRKLTNITPTVQKERKPNRKLKKMDFIENDDKGGKASLLFTFVGGDGVCVCVCVYASSPTYHTRVAHLFCGGWRRAGGRSLCLRSLRYAADGPDHLGHWTQSAVRQRALPPGLCLRCRVHCDKKQKTAGRRGIRHVDVQSEII